MELEDIKKELHTLGRNVEMILSMLESNPKFKKEGLVEQVLRIDETLDKIQSKLDMMWFKLTWFAVMGGAAVQILWFAFSKIFPVIFKK